MLTERKLTNTGIRTPVRPARSQSLYQLHHPDSQNSLTVTKASYVANDVTFIRRTSLYVSQLLRCTVIPGQQQLRVVPSQPDRTHTPQVQNYAAKHRPSTRQNICESLRVIPVNHRSVLPDDWSHKIRNMSQWFFIFCLLNIYSA